MEWTKLEKKFGVYTNMATGVKEFILQYVKLYVFKYISYLIKI